MPLLLPLTGTCYCHRTCLTPACYCRSLASHPPASSRVVLLLLHAGAEGTAAVSPPALQACLQEPEGSAVEAPRSGQQSAQAPGLQGGAHAHADKEKGQRLAGWVWTQGTRKKMVGRGGQTWICAARRAWAWGRPAMLAARTAPRHTRRGARRGGRGASAGPTEAN